MVNYTVAGALTNNASHFGGANNSAVVHAVCNLAAFHTADKAACEHVSIDRSAVFAVLYKPANHFTHK